MVGVRLPAGHDVGGHALREVGPWRAAAIRGDNLATSAGGIDS
jgi:hypothetical protein